MTTLSAPLDPRRFQSALLFLLGPLFIGISFVLMLRRVEPVTTLFYLCAWYGIIWTLDRLIQATRSFIELYLHQGIGVEYGNLLVKAGIRSLADLAVLSAAQLEDRINALPRNIRRPTPAQIRLWIRRIPGP